MDKDQEEIFCIRRSDLEMLFGSPMPNGALKGPLIEDVLRLKVFFLPRNQAENNPDYKQIIPYQIFHSDKRFFVYRRGEQIGEGRLTGRLSIGIGGHINIMDIDPRQDPCLSYSNALMRERTEELSGFKVVKEAFLGWINDETEPVGKVHLGAVHLCDVVMPEKINTKDGEGIHLVGWWTKEDILAKGELFESWSIIATSLFV